MTAVPLLQKSIRYGIFHAAKSQAAHISPERKEGNSAAKLRLSPDAVLSPGQHGNPVIRVYYAGPHTRKGTAAQIENIAEAVIIPRARSTEEKNLIRSHPDCLPERDVGIRQILFRTVCIDGN